MPKQVPRRTARSRQGPQLGLPLDEAAARRLAHPGWGGPGRGGGRKPRGARALVPHSRRDRHAAAHPVHVTMRARRDVPTLRSQRMMAALRDVFAKAGAAHAPRFRVVHFSVQRDHVHLLVEASDAAALRSGSQGLAIRAARAVNRATRMAGGRGRGRTGKVWADRHHRRELRTPREVRNALAYVLLNHRKHLPDGGTVDELTRLDPCSSAAWFDGWRTRAGPGLLAFRATIPRPTSAPRTWLAATGWRRHGLIHPRERPATM